MEVREGQPAEGLDHIDGNYKISLLCSVHNLLPHQHLQSISEKRYASTQTLYTTQKQTNLTNSLLQDIAIFKDHDSEKLEEWLTDLKTAADLTNESWAELVKAKSGGPTCTLVREAINSVKIYTSHFMNIQQWEKESLSAYVHQFRIEAKHCNFTNDTAIIRIFIKGLKNAHSLASRIYEKDPHTLMDTITEVKKLITAQQLTMTIILSSTVNMMSNEEDQYLWGQEQGHIICHCPHIRCHECNEYGHTIMDYPQRIPPSGMPAPHYKAHRNSHTRAQHTTRKTEKVETDLDHSLDTANTIAPAIVNCTEAAPDHNDRTGTVTIEAAQGNPIQHTGDTVTGHAMTHHTSHTTNPPHTAVYQATTLRIAVDCVLNLLTNHQNIAHTRKNHAV